MSKDLKTYTMLLSVILLLSTWHGGVLALSAAEAAEQARSQTGGKVLRVQSKSDGRFRVKVLMPSGQVRNVSIGDSSVKHYQTEDRTKESSDRKNKKVKK